MKILRTSFPQLIREKILKGENEPLPDPTNFTGLGYHPNIDNFDSIDFSKGQLVYREEDVIHTDASDNVWYTQGPIGFGDVPTGPGTKPYYTLLTNAKRNAAVDTPGIYTGIDPQTDLDVAYLQNVPGPFGYGYTYSVGQLEQKYTPAGGNPNTAVDVKLPPGRHVLFTIGSSLYGGLRSENQLQAFGIGANQPYVMHAGNSTEPKPAWDQNNCLHFIYEETGDKQFKLYVVRGKGVFRDGFNSDPANIDGYSNVTLPPADPTVQIHSSYGRFLPVHLIVRPDGTGEFRVDTGKLMFNINNMPAADGSNFRMVAGTTVTDWGCPLIIYGLQTRHYTDSVQHGMERPLVFLANVAINNSDNSDGLGDNHIPPFIAGIPMTPIRRHSEHDHADNERPLRVDDQHEKKTGDAAWIPYNIFGQQVSYNEPLESAVDGQMYSLNGVASQELSGSLDIVMSYDRIKSRWQEQGNAIAATGIEAINVTVNNAAVFNTTPNEYSLGLAIDGDGQNGDWIAGWQRVDAGNYNERQIDYSHNMFLNKYHIDAAALTGWGLDDFNQEVVLKAMAMETIHI